MLNLSSCFPNSYPVTFPDGFQDTLTLQQALDILPEHSKGLAYTVLSVAGTAYAGIIYAGASSWCMPSLAYKAPYPVGSMHPTYGLVDDVEPPRRYTDGHRILCQGRWHKV